MTHIISLHSFRGGTGKSNLAANLATVFTAAGRRVGIIDTDIQSPGIHILFGLNSETIRHSLNDYLWGKCAIEAAAHDVTAAMNLGPDAGQAYLIPASMHPGEIARILRDGYNVGLLSDGIRQAIIDLQLDVLLIDTHPGLSEETLLAVAIANTLLVVMRPDEQDVEGTGVAVQVARRLDVSRLWIVVNKCPAAFDEGQVRQQVEKAYDSHVAAILPHADEFMTLASKGLFVQEYPDHVVSQRVRQLGHELMMSGR